MPLLTTAAPCLRRVGRRARRRRWRWRLIWAAWKRPPPEEQRVLEQQINACDFEDDSLSSSSSSSFFHGYNVREATRCDFDLVECSNCAPTLAPLVGFRQSAAAFFQFNRRGLWTAHFLPTPVLPLRRHWHSSTSDGEDVILPVGATGDLKEPSGRRRFQPGIISHQARADVRLLMLFNGHFLKSAAL